MTTEARIQEHALRIPPDARLRLAAKLLASVPASGVTCASEEEALALALQRASAIDGGRARAVDYSAEMKRIRASILQCD